MMRKINRCCIKAPERLNSAEIAPKTFEELFVGENVFIFVTGVLNKLNHQFHSSIKYYREIGQLYSSTDSYFIS